MRSLKSSVFYGQTTSLCETCLDLVPTKILIEGNDVFYQKRCQTHGVQKTLVSTDAAYYRRCRDYLKPADIPLQFQSRTHHGCPYDCGLCPDHEQHSCLALIEINENCNLTCPICFADSAPERSRQRSLAEIEIMLGTLVASEGEPDLLQISGGEPTIHPEILEILRRAKQRPIRHLMLNTNGVRIANDPAFVAELAKLGAGFEVYLQFDSLRKEALENIRGADLRGVRQRALANLEAAGVSTTLVVVVKKGVNDDEVGEIVRHALTYDCLRGVTFQPVQDAGHNLDFDKNRDRAFLTDIRRVIAETSGVFAAQDPLPLPCNPEAIAIGYGLRDGQSVTPITRLIDLLSLSCTGEQTDPALRGLLCCLPQFEVPSGLGYDKVFRVVIVQFLDRFNFCIAAVKRSCIHFVTAERKIIPFDTYNLFYREGLPGRRRPGLGPNELAEREPANV
jgi:tetraether lipid synthase